MSRIVGSPGVSNVTSWEELRRYTSKLFELILPVINGGIDFQNFTCSVASINFTAANQTLAVPHDLPFVPTGYLVTYQNSPAVIYGADAAVYFWTTSNIYLTASAPVIANLIII